MRIAIGVGLFVLSACGGSEASPAEEAPAAAAQAALEGCESAADCHYDDACMPEACQLEAPESVDCDETMLPAGPCVCVERRCEMQVPEAAQQPEAAGCSSDAECFFDSVCTPSACTTERPDEDVACSESWPPPGDCHCLAGRCAMQRFEPMQSGDACSASAPCGWNLAYGRCLPGQADESDAVPAGGAQPVCRCSGGYCHGGWVEPVACTAVEDCWVEEGPLGAQPIARPRARRRRAFRPCVDGEVAPTCVEGRCGLAHFGC